MGQTPVIESPSQLRRVLIVKLSSLGDIIHTLPLLDSLRAGLPDVYLAWAVRRRFVDLVAGNPNLDAVFTLERKRLPDVLRLSRELRAAQFDTALDVQGLFYSGLIARLSGAKRRIGYDWNREANSLWLTHPVVPSRVRRHMTEKIMDFCPALGVPALPPRPQTYLAEQEAETAKELLSTAETKSGPRIGFVIGASTVSKTWPADRWVETARQLAAQGMQPILIGGPAERESAEQIVAEAKGAVTLNLAGKTPLRALGAVLARCAVVVGGDTGATHLAVAVGAPVIGLYGTSDPIHAGPNWGPERAILLDYNTQVPPEARRFRHEQTSEGLACIPVSAVVEAVPQLLAGTLGEEAMALAKSPPPLSVSPALLS